MQSIDTRLRKLEERQPVHIILETVINGKAERMTTAEFVEAGLDFLSARIVEGNSLKDAELLLSLFPSVIE